MMPKTPTFCLANEFWTALSIKPTPPVVRAPFVPAPIASRRWKRSSDMARWERDGIGGYLRGSAVSVGGERRQEDGILVCSP